MSTTNVTSFSPAARPTIVDDKSPHCIPFILSLVSFSHPQASSAPKPFIIALNGVQGAGKTTLVSALAATLQAPPHNLPTLVLSIDDLYLPHAAQTALASAHPENPLVQHRGEPGTHDMALARDVFERLKKGEECRVPAYDKSAHGGQGDRVAPEQWRTVNAPALPKIRVVIFEGWCVGFRALPEAEVVRRREAPNRTLARNRLEDLLFVNRQLVEYEVLNREFDAFIHIDAEETDYVYAWRQEQEAALRKESGAGMSADMVTRFVDGYYPAYELYTDTLRQGVFKEKEAGAGRQLSLLVGRDRRVKEVIRI